LIAAAALLMPGALAYSAQADATVYTGKGLDDPKVKVRILANEQRVSFLKPRNFKVRFDDKDRTSPRFKDNDKLNTMKLPLEARPSGRWRFEQSFKGKSDEGSKVKIDILGSLNSDFTRAQGWFKFRVVLGPDEDLPEGTIGTTGKVRWRVSQR
jgi:hypothetical protein